MDKKLIGKGYWYNVFDLGNGRVLKQEKGFIQKIKDTYYSEEKKFFKYLKALFRLFTGRKKIFTYYYYIKKNVDLNSVGSPKFLNGIDYEQDKINVLAAVLAESDFEKAKNMVDAYIQNIFDCWKSGFSDKVYNFTINCGINDSGQLILFDFNEITTSKEETLKRIQSKRWLRAWSFKYLDPKLQKYYQEQMDLLITPEALGKFWRIKKSL